MEKEKNSIGVVQKPNGEIYFSYGSNQYMNIRTGVSGQIDEKISSKIGGNDQRAPRSNTAKHSVDKNYDREQ